MVDLEAIAAELGHLAATPAEVSPDDPDELVSYIIARHHAYVREAMPSIQAHLAKVIAAHGKRHPEVIRISSHFDVLAEDFTQHLAKEEQVLFPYIRMLSAALRHGAPLPPDMFGTVVSPSLRV